MAADQDNAEGGEVSSPDTQNGEAQNMSLPEIASLRNTDKRQYFSPEVQARELQLIEERGLVEASTHQPWWQDGQQDTLQDASTDVVPLADLPTELQHARLFADAVLAGDALGDATREAFTTELSPAAQDALIEEMKLSPGTDAVEPTEQQMADFRDSPESEVIWDEWGEDGPHKLGVVMFRWNRFRNSLPAHERTTFDALFDGLPPAAIEQVYRELAG